MPRSTKNNREERERTNMNDQNIVQLDLSKINFSVSKRSANSQSESSIPSFRMLLFISSVYFLGILTRISHYSLILGAWEWLKFVLRIHACSELVSKKPTLFFKGNTRDTSRQTLSPAYHFIIKNLQIYISFSFPLVTIWAD